MNNKKMLKNHRLQRARRNESPKVDDLNIFSILSLHCSSDFRLRLSRAFWYLFLMILFNSFVFASFFLHPNNDMIRNLCCGPSLIVTAGISLSMNIRRGSRSSWHLCPAAPFVWRSEDVQEIPDSAGATFPCLKGVGCGRVEVGKSQKSCGDVITTTFIVSKSDLRFRCRLSCRGIF